MNRRRARLVLIVAVFLLPAWSALAQQKRARPTAPARGPAVATVGSASLPAAELDMRTQAALAQYRQSSGNRDLPPEMMDLLRRQVVESMIRLQLLAFEADRTGMRATPEEAEQALRQAPEFNPGGKFDPARFQAAKTMQKPAYDAAIAAISRQLGARRLFATLEARYQPTEADARAAAARQLTRALVDHFSLRLSDFAGTVPEPRERAVADWYAAHRNDYRVPDRATLTVAFVNQPQLDDPAHREAWTRRMRTVADSLLALMSRGASYDSVTRSLGPRASLVVAADNFPGYWRGTAAQDAKLFDPRSRGHALTEPVASGDGWLLVRVDDVTPAHQAPLREVAREIRANLRRDLREHHEEYAERALYAQLRDSMAGPGWPLRYASVDTSTLAPARPSEADLDHWYRAHQADYSSFDGRTGGIVVRPFAEVREDIARRLAAEQRAQQGQELVDALVRAWSAGRRDPAAEARVGVRETPPLVPGSAIDTGLVATALTDTLWQLGTPRGAGVVPYARGWIVWTALARVARVVPTFEQARPALALRLQEDRAGEDVAGARAFFARDSMRFNLGPVIHFSRLAITPPPILSVRLTRAEVEKWHHDHMERYSATELVTARHILVRPRDASPAADAAARAKAEDLLRRVRAGEDFAQLAKTYSDDPATRDAGGDLGAFGRGTMLDAFEKAAFALEPGQICDHPVRTEVGYHVIQCTDHVPAYVHPLPLIYSNVSSDAAMAKADVIARQRTDSLLAVARTPRALAATARKLGYAVLPQRYQAGSDMPTVALKDFFEELQRLKPGQGHTTPVYMKGEGYWVAWVDSVTPPVPPTWQDVRSRVLAEYRRGAGERALEAKRAELDSMAAAGWSYDSLAALWGGPDHALDVTPGRGITGLGVSAELDSLVFGTAHGAPLPPGRPSGWIALPSGITRIRVTDRVPPPTDALASRAATLRSAELERRLREYFAGLEKRYPVRILDPKLRDVALAEPPPGLTP